MPRSVDVLFKPFRDARLSLENRIVMAPMTRSFSPGGVPDDNVVAYYRRRAEAGVGLILTEGVAIDTAASVTSAAVPNLVTSDAKAGWKKVVDAVHAAGGRIGAQLWHEGGFRSAKASWRPELPSLSASGLRAPGKPNAEPMTEAEIETAIEAYVAAAAAAKAIGFDCVEFHGAHSYLIDGFFWDKVNLRTDKWGAGSWTDRTRFAVEIIRRARAAVGPDFPLLIRLSQWKQQDFNAKTAATPAELESWVTPLVEAGIDIFHGSQRRFWEPEFEGSDLNFAGWLKKITGKPSISVGSVGLTGEFTAAFAGESSKPASLDALIDRMERGDFDLIAVGRALLQDPHWAEKVRAGRMTELKDFTQEALGVLH